MSNKEQEHQVQRAPPAEAAMHNIHQDVRLFASSGVYNSSSEAYMPAFQTLCNTSAAVDFHPAQLNAECKLLVTVDFARTIQTSDQSPYMPDAFQRSVEWLLTNRVEGSNTVDRILIISPYEANELYKAMGSSTAATLHVYRPRTDPNWPAFDQLDLLTRSASPDPAVPSALNVQLALFAGQLYISSYEQYLEICKFLGIATEVVTQEMTDKGWEVDAVGFILRDDQGRIGGESGLQKSPVNFFKILMSKIRNQGKSIAKTHIGQVLDGKIFHESDFEAE